MKIEISGLSQLLAAFTKAGVELPKEFSQAMSYSVSSLRDTAQSLVPVRTNALRSSITTSVDTNPLIGKVIVGQPYGKYVEYGTGIYATGPGGSQAQKIPWVYRTIDGQFYTTSGQRPQPFMQPAFDNNIAKVQGYFQTAIKKVLGYFQ